MKKATLLITIIYLVLPFLPASGQMLAPPLEENELFPSSYSSIINTIQGQIIDYDWPARRLVLSSVNPFTAQTEQMVFAINNQTKFMRGTENIASVDIGIGDYVRIDFVEDAQSGSYQAVKILVHL